MTTAIRKAILQSWAKPLLTEQHRFKVAYGGRGSGKTWQMAGALVILGVIRPLRICCAREHQSSIGESCKQTLERWIEELGLNGVHYRVARDYIEGANGTHIFFRGMSTATEEAIRGWESVDICWVEEAQRMSARSREILYPTIRKPGSELWFSFNPANRYDPVYVDFIARPRPNAWIQRVNYNDNLFFPAELDEERRFCLENDPERYPHIWLGEPDDEGAERKVLPYELLSQCVSADWYGYGGMLHAGLDVADSGSDKNCLVIRRGPAVEYVVQWSAGTLGQTARRADALCREWGVRTLYYDAGGVGAGIKSYLNEMPTRPYGAHGVNFGEAVAGGTNLYMSGHTNADFFARRNAQLGWALRQRAQRTRRFRDGATDFEHCLFINAKIPGLEAYLAQLSQPQWAEQLAGRISIDKCPDDAPSPDMYDATALAFAHDSRHGLRARDA